MAETRTIEKYGILKLLPEDRGAQNLIVLADVIQLPYSEYLNVKSNPSKGHYGYACFMYKEYVREIVDIQFRRQVILDWTGYVVQLAHQEYCNSKEIAQQVGSLWNPTAVEYPILNFDEIRFKLEPGVILSVLKSSIPMKICDTQGILQPDLSPPSTYVPPPPQAPPPENAPDSEKIPLSAPYEGTNDDGNTYVRTTPTEPEPTGQGDCGVSYNVSYEYTYVIEGYPEDTDTGTATVSGKIMGIGFDGGQIFIRSDLSACGGSSDARQVLTQSPFPVVSCSGTVTIISEVQ